MRLRTTSGLLVSSKTLVKDALPGHEAGNWVGGIPVQISEKFKRNATPWFTSVSVPTGNYVGKNTGLGKVSSLLMLSSGPSSP